MRGLVFVLVGVAQALVSPGKHLGLTRLAGGQALRATADVTPPRAWSTESGRGLAEALSRAFCVTI